MILAAFIFCLFIVFYVYAGYPLLLWLIARNKSLSVPEPQVVGDVTVVLVVCNEAQVVKNKLINLVSLDYPDQHLKIIVVDDASDDDTCEIVKNFPDSRIQLIRSEHRKGKANGLNLAMSQVTSELVLLVDARQEIEKQSIKCLASWFATNDNVVAVSGELMFRLNEDSDFAQGVDGYWRYEKFIRKNEALISSVPGVTGAIYMLKASEFQPIPTNTLLDDVQIPMVASKNGGRVLFDERAIAWDVPSQNEASEKRRKIRTLSGNYQLLFRFPQWILPFGHANWWQFLSHKILRLLAPFFALLSGVLALFLALDGTIWAIGYLILAVGALSLYPLSYFVTSINKNKLLRLLVSFITLNWFCILAAYHYFFSSNSGSWKQ